MQTYYGSSLLKNIFYGNTPVNRVYHGSELVYCRDVTFTIDPSPADATVVLTATGYTQSGNSITVQSGTSVTYSVSKQGYTTVSDTILVTGDMTTQISLENQ